MNGLPVGKVDRDFCIDQSAKLEIRSWAMRAIGNAHQPRSQVSNSERVSWARLQFLSSAAARRSSANLITTSTAQGPCDAVCGDRPWLWSSRRWRKLAVKPM